MCLIRTVAWFKNESVFYSTDASKSVGPASCDVVIIPRGDVLPTREPINLFQTVYGRRHHSHFTGVTVLVVCSHWHIPDIIDRLPSLRPSTSQAAIARCASWPVGSHHTRMSPNFLESLSPSVTTDRLGGRDYRIIRGHPSTGRYEHDLYISRTRTRCHAPLHTASWNGAYQVVIHPSIRDNEQCIR